MVDAGVFEGRRPVRRGDAMSGRWKAVGLVVGLLLGACGAPAEPSPGPRPGATAPAEEAAASPSPAPTRTRLPTLTPAPLAFRPQPLPEGFRTGDHWLAVRVVREFAKERTAYTADTYAIWFTDGQRWLGPVPEVGLYITRLERAFWRRAGDGWELARGWRCSPRWGRRRRRWCSARRHLRGWVRRRLLRPLRRRRRARTAAPSA
jgi:hypothetical protein